MIYAELNLPPMILLEHYGGHFLGYYEAVYQAFRADFIDRPASFRGVRLGLKKYPLVDGKEATFYHMTHEGADEANRTPDMRRMERIVWPKPIIDSSECNELKVWKNKRGRDTRVLIWHEEENYLVVLNDRGDYILPWTAYLVIHEHKRRKLKSEYEAYKKAEAAQRG